MLNIRFAFTGFSKISRPNSSLFCPWLKYRFPEKKKFPNELFHQKHLANSFMPFLMNGRRMILEKSKFRFLKKRSGQHSIWNTRFAFLSGVAALCRLLNTTVIFI